MIQRRKIMVTGPEGIGDFFDPTEQPSDGFERHEFSIAEHGALVIYYRLANRHVDLSRNVAAYAPGKWTSVFEVRDL